jgi:tetratricopeptide (TPR) repeat protein
MSPRCFPRAASTIWCLLVVIFLVGGIDPAGADSPDEADEQTEQTEQTELAKEHFYRAEKLFALRRFERALNEYEAAFEAKPIADFLFNIGQCHVNLGNYSEAIFSFRKFLKLKPNAKNRDQVEEYIATLDKKQADKPRDEPPLELVPKDGNTSVDKPKSRRFYTRWWFWTGVAAVAAGTTALLVYDGDPALPLTDLGNLDFPR